MSNLFYRNFQLLILTICLIVVWGLSSFLSLPRMEDPELTPRSALVTTRFPGATAERVEALVTEKVEQELLEIEEIDTLESTSRVGISTISIQLKDEVVKVDEVWSRIRNSVADVTSQLPPNALEPSFDEIDVRAKALIVALTWELDSETNYAIMGRLSEELEEQLRSVAGTEKVELFGDPDEEIVVEISPSDLASLGLTAQDLSQQILRSDAKVAAGQLRSSSNELLFEVEGELDSLARISSIPIRFGDRGQFTRLGDIAQVKKGIVEPASDLALINGQPAIALGVLVESGERLEQWAKTAKATLEEFRTQLPHGIGLQVILDQSRYVEARINGVINELLFGSMLAMSVILFMMGWKSALVVSSSLPLSALMVFGGMKVLGIPLHQISVTGIIIALGLLIDNAIVIADEVQNRLHEGMAPKKAVAQSVRHMTVPLLSSTLTTVLAFLPIALAPGGVGEFTGTIGMSAILGIVSSLVLSLTVLPALAGRLHCWGRGQIPTKLAWWQAGVSHPGLTRVYRWTLDKTFARPILGIALALIVPVSGFLMAPNLEQQFFPPSGRDQFYIEAELPAQAPLAQTQSKVLQARELIRRHPDVVNVHWFIGKSAPRFYYNLLGGRENSANYAQGLVQLRPNVQPRPVIQTLQGQLDQAFPQAQVVVRQLEQGPPFAAPIEVRLYGPDLERLRELGNQMRAELAQVTDVLHTRANLTEALPKLGLNVDEEQARLAGLDKTAIAQQLETSLEGSIGGSIMEDTEELPVRVRLSNLERSTLNNITSLDLLPSSNAADGKRPTIPLSALGDVELVPNLATISRRNGERVNTVQGFITAGVLPAKVQADFKKRLVDTGFQLPSGYSFDFGGEADERDTAVANMVSTVGVLGILMVATLVLTFNSFALAGLIALVALLSVGLGIGSLWLFGYPFGFTAILGTIGLIGIAVNESTVVLAALHEHPLARQGDEIAAREVVVHATRHMIATTVTDMVGFVPILFDKSGFWPPLAIIVVGGLGGTTLLTLYLLPAAYLLIRRWNQQLVSIKRRTYIVAGRQ
ncbi:efflux RND transporter permease subunit [Cyanobacteria bacterium FACHB-472]|nr:efflux RND transporter permease subunit [Cyanobacteria bacterium FACHB-472]